MIHTILDYMILPETDKLSILVRFSGGSEEERFPDKAEDLVSFLESKLIRLKTHGGAETYVGEVTGAFYLLFEGGLRELESIQKYCQNNNILMDNSGYYVRNFESCFKKADETESKKPEEKKFELYDPWEVKIPGERK